MGSRSPRQHSIPRDAKRPNRPIEPASAQTGLRMESISTFVGFAAFPVAIGAAGIAYISQQDSRNIAVALVLTFVAAGIIILLARSRRRWRQDARMTNELLLGMLVGGIGVTFVIGGLAGLSAVWIGAGIATLVIAALVARAGNRRTA